MLRLRWSLRVVRAARVWALCRAGRVTGDTYHQACGALSDAVDALEGRVARPRRPIPTGGEISASQVLVERAKARRYRRMPPPCTKRGGS